MVSRSWSRGGVEGGGWEGTGVDIIMMEARDNAQPRDSTLCPLLLDPGGSASLPLSCRPVLQTLCYAFVYSKFISSSVLD